MKLVRYAFSGCLSGILDKKHRLCHNHICLNCDFMYSKQANLPIEEIHVWNTFDQIRRLMVISPMVTS
jgi:hypothetical protein